jgi:hypothetical protein
VKIFVDPKNLTSNKFSRIYTVFNDISIFHFQISYVRHLNVTVAWKLNRANMGDVKL